MIDPKTPRVWYCPRCDRAMRYDPEDARHCPRCGAARRDIPFAALPRARQARHQLTAIICRRGR